MLNFIKENWMSLTALIISIVGFFKDNIKDIIIHNKAKKEDKSAKLMVSFINEKLIISNKGKSNARNITIYIDNIEIQKNDTFGAFAKNMDFSLLTSNNSIGIKSIIHTETKRNFKIKITWEDDNSKNNIIEDVINI